jgi:hypothetical protein
MSELKRESISPEQSSAAKITYDANKSRINSIDHDIAELEMSVKEKVNALKAERDLLRDQNRNLKGTFSPLRIGGFYSVSAYRFVGKPTTFHCIVECTENNVEKVTGESPNGEAFSTFIWGKGKVVKVSPHEWGLHEFEVGQIIDLYFQEVDEQMLEKRSQDVFVIAPKS